MRDDTLQLSAVNADALARAFVLAAQLLDAAGEPGVGLAHGLEVITGKPLLVSLLNAIDLDGEAVGVTTIVAAAICLTLAAWIAVIIRCQHRY